MSHKKQLISANLRRRHFLGAAMAASAFAAIGPVNAQGKTEFRIQYDWLIDNGKIGDIAAAKNGYFDKEGLTVTFSPGGPNAQTVPSVLAGQALGGQMGSNQVLAAYGEGFPVRMFATTYQNSPLMYVSLPRSPVRAPQDLIGKTVAVTPNGRWILNLMLAVNKIDPAQVKLVTLGTDLTPLILGQVDVAASFLTNTQALAVLGPTRVVMTAESAGIPYYTGTYFTSADDYEKRKDVLARFTRAVARGWGWAYENRKAAVDLMCDAYPNLDRKVEHATVDIIMGMAFNKSTKDHGWGWFDNERMEREIKLFSMAGGFTKRVPDLAGVATQEILNMTSDARPKLG